MKKTLLRPLLRSVVCLGDIMCPFIHIFGKEVPGYGAMIVLGLLLANLLMYYKLEKSLRNDFFILEGYILLGAMVGAKLLYLVISIGQIDWSRWKNIDYMLSMIKGGFVFYGGLIGGAAGCYWAEKMHKIQSYRIVRSVIFGVPLAHGFGRVGCFMAGCCYGVEYDGVLSVTYPKQTFGPSGVSCFPVQLLEAVLLWLLAVLVFLATKESTKYNPIGIYLVGYSIMRFFLEYLRADTARGGINGISTSQLISILIICISIKVIGLKREDSKLT